MSATAKDIIAGWIADDWDDTSVLSDQHYQGARRLLSALESAGYVVVPKEPTERMLKAYYDCMDKPKPPSPRNKATTMMNPNKFLQHTHKATVRYKAMLSAAKEAGE